MSLKVSAIILSSVTIIMFQNCSEADFGSGSAASGNTLGFAQAGPDSGTVAGADLGNGGANSNDGDDPSSGSAGIPGSNSSAPTPLPNKCFEITCVSDANAANTFSAVTDARGVIAKTAPSTGSTWVLRWTNQGLREGHNCWSDQQVNGGDRPDHSGLSLCRDYGGTVPLGAAMTFNGGHGKNFKLCEYDPCGTSRAQTYLDANNVHHWVKSKPQGTSSLIKIRATGWGQISPREFTVEFSLASGQCVTKTFSYTVLASGVAVNAAYRVCNTAGSISGELAGRPLDLNLGP